MAFAGVLADADVTAAIAACSGKTFFFVVYIIYKLWRSYIWKMI